MAGMIAQLLATDAARVKLGARDISTAEAEQLPRNLHATMRNPRAGAKRGIDSCSSAAPMAGERSPSFSNAPLIELLAHSHRLGGH